MKQATCHTQHVNVDSLGYKGLARQPPLVFYSVWRQQSLLVNVGLGYKELKRDWEVHIAI